VPVPDLHAISSYGPSASSTRVRLNDWFRFLHVEANNHYFAGLNNNRPSSIAGNAIAVARAELGLRHLDLSGQRVIISREASPFSQGGVEERLLRRAERGVYDFDDALYADPSPLRALLRTKDKCARATAAADVVITGNAELASWAAEYNDQVRLIPSCVDPRDYHPKADWSITAKAPVLLWLGSPATESYVAHIAPALLEVNRATGARLILVSGPRDNPDLGPLNKMVARIPWNIATFPAAMSKADVAIAPLDDTAYSRGKCAYKLLQYAATALPIVGSPVGANALALRRFDSLAASSGDDWVQGLLQVIGESPSQRSARGLVGRAAVEAHYSFNAWAQQWCEATGVTPADRTGARS
jgi:glycosyltransferase involved in cell wall biosynthesis